MRPERDTAGTSGRERAGARSGARFAAGDTLLYLVPQTAGEILGLVDRAAAAVLLPLAVWILVSGLDELFVLAVWLLHRGKAPRAPTEEERSGAAEKRIAIFVPCWREAGVIGQMVEHNTSAIRYRNYQFFIGAYPNDAETVAAVGELERRYERVRLCLCPHDGPTSKADCLNWIYQRMLLFEEEHGVRFDMVVIHDAEDLIHPEALEWINYYGGTADMVQLPVLPLATPLRKLTHGLYCDEFAELHTKDLAARQALGGFIPSAGVGTGYTREALEDLAAAESNRVFEPGCLTEDYENGLRLHRRGWRQVFVPVTFRNGGPVATREFFPQRLRWAVKQRTRWVTGIALQSWQRHGWKGGPRQWYWLWRDRKGVISHGAGLLANLVFGWGALTWLGARAGGGAWRFGELASDPALRALLAANVVLLSIQLGTRCWCAARIYGWVFALGAPLRMVYGNWLNAVSSARAVAMYARARLAGQPLVWVKTEHAYPSRAALMPHKRPLEEILVGSGYLTESELRLAQATKPRGVRLAEYLVQAGFLSEEDLYEALSLQLGLALGKIDPAQVRLDVARSLPAHVVREWNVLPVRIEAGSLHLASPDLPTEELREALRRFTRLEIKVEVVTPTNFRRLCEALL